MDDVEKLQAARARLREVAAILDTVGIAGVESIVESVVDQVQYVEVLIYADEDV